MSSNSKAQTFTFKPLPRLADDYRPRPRFIVEGHKVGRFALRVESPTTIVCRNVDRFDAAREAGAPNHAPGFAAETLTVRSVEHYGGVRLTTAAEHESGADRSDGRTAWMAKEVPPEAFALRTYSAEFWSRTGFDSPTTAAKAALSDAAQHVVSAFVATPEGKAALRQAGIDVASDRLANAIEVSLRAREAWFDSLDNTDKAREAKARAEAEAKAEFSKGESD